jgi:hypothetical protein
MALGGRRAQAGRGAGLFTAARSAVEGMTEAILCGCLSRNADSLRNDK